MRQGFISTQCDPPGGVSIATLAYEYPPDCKVPEHAHGSDQLVYASSGVMEVASGQSVWLIPPHFALWIPARTAHRIHMTGAVSMRSLYVRSGLAPGMPQQCRVLHVTPLLRELILETVRMGRLRARNRLERSLRDVLLSQLRNATPVPTFLTLPRDPRALAIAQGMLANPGRCSPLSELCGETGVGVRTIQRAFRKDVGTDFESWRRQARLMKAVELLVSGSSIKEASFSVGYRQPSAFVEMFRRTLGATPKVWVRELQRMNSV